MLKIDAGLDAYDPSYGATQAAHARAFRRDAMAFLQSLASELELPPDSYDLFAETDDEATSGEVVLHADHLYVQLHEGMDVEVMFRHCDARDDDISGQNHFVAMNRLRDERMATQFVEDCRALMEPSSS